MLIALQGLTSGALHAVAGPDHLLGLAPLAAETDKPAWRLGASWGLGHAAGTSLVAIAAAALFTHLDLTGMAEHSERLAGLALIIIGLWGLLRRPVALSSAGATRGAVMMGTVHGVLGAASLLLLLPALVSGSWAEKAGFLLAFSLGSTIAMAWMTAALSRLARGRRPGLSGRVRRWGRIASALSIVVGAFWLL